MQRLFLSVLTVLAISPPGGFANACTTAPVSSPFTGGNHVRVAG